MTSSDVPARLGPKATGFGLARAGFGFLKSWAKPKPTITAWPWPGLAQAKAFGTNSHQIFVSGSQSLRGPGKIIYL
jgi:hypothetical protein